MKDELCSKKALLILSSTVSELNEGMIVSSKMLMIHVCILQRKILHFHFEIKAEVNANENIHDYCMNSDVVSKVNVNCSYMIGLCNDLISMS